MWFWSNRYEKKLAEMRAEFESERAEKNALEEKKKNSHRIANLNEDPALCGVVTYYLDEGDNIVGRKAKQNTVNPNIALAGISILDHHATMTLSDGKVSIRLPEGSSDESSVLLNGKPLVGVVTLRHFDRILFGSNHL